MIGSNTQQVIAPRPASTGAFPELHTVMTPKRDITMRGRIAKGILHKTDAALNLSSGGLFQIRTVIIDNHTSQWLWIAEAQRFARPWVVNFVIPLEGVGQISVIFQSPLSIAQAAFTGAQPDSVYVTALENRWPPQSGEVFQVV